MGLWSIIGRAARGLFARDADVNNDAAWSNTFDRAVSTASGPLINQATALNVTAVLAVATMLSEDAAKLGPMVCRREASGERIVLPDHYLSKLLKRPNSWQDGFEFREMMMLSLVLRGNAYAVIGRNGRGQPIKLVPINADRVAVWESPDGGLYYRVTPNGLHEMAELRGQPFLIPAEDMLHIRGFTANGLVGASRITLARESIGLALGYERQAANWLGNGSVPSGILTTDSKLDAAAAARISQDWKTLNGGLGNAGKVAVLEQGLKFEKIVLSASDLEFIASRKFQLEEVARLWRVPPHKIGVLDKSTNNNIEAQGQDYINDTLTGYTARWSARLEFTFNLDEEGLFVDWDFSILTRANQTARYNNYRTGVMSGFVTPDEARIDDDKKPKGGKADDLQQPSNMAGAGSQSTGTKADGGGRPEGSGNTEGAADAA